MSIKISYVNGKACHFIVGLVIKDKGKYLLGERKNYPFGFAAPCGHIRENETVEEAILRKLKTETNLDLIESKLVFEGVVAVNPCRLDGIYDHMTYIFEVKTKGEFKLDPEGFRNCGWYTAEEISKLELEPMWHQVFLKLGLLK